MSARERRTMRESPALLNAFSEIIRRSENTNVLVLLDVSSTSSFDKTKPTNVQAVFIFRVVAILYCLNSEVISK